MKTVYQVAEDMGLKREELLPYGHFMGKIDYQAVMRRRGDRPDGKYVNVTAITPTPLGEGKSTTTIGLVQGLGRLGKKASAAIRQPSGGPTMGEGIRRGWRAFPVHSVDPVFAGGHRRHQRRDERAQPRHGGADVPYAA